MSELNKINPERTIEVVTVEIKTIQTQAQKIILGYAIEIGRRLVEAKQLLPHGGWGEWLKNEVDFSQSTANNFMRIFEEYGADQQSILGGESNSQTLGNLPYTKALALLALPENEREEFVENNDVEQMSSRELQAAIRERDEATKRAEELEKAAAANGEEIQRLQEQREHLEKVMEDAMDATESAEGVVELLKAELEELKNRPINVAVTGPDDKALAAARKEAAAEAKKKAEAALTKQIEKAESEKAAAESAKAKAEQALAAAQVAQEKNAVVAAKEKEAMSEQMDEMRKKFAVASSSEMSIFKIHFEEAQSQLNKLIACVVRMSEAGENEMADKTTGALRQLLQATLDAVGGQP